MPRANKYIVFSLLLLPPVLAAAGDVNVIVKGAEKVAGIVEKESAVSGAAGASAITKELSYGLVSVRQITQDIKRENEGLLTGGGAAAGFDRNVSPSAKTAQKISRAIKNGMSSAVNDPAFAGMAPRITVPAPARSYYGVIGRSVLGRLDGGDYAQAYASFKNLSRQEISNLNADVTSGYLPALTREKISEFGEALTYFESTRFRGEAWLKDARKFFDHVSAGFHTLPPDAQAYIADANGQSHIAGRAYKIIDLNSHWYKRGRTPGLPIRPDGNTFYRGMGLNEEDLRNIAANGLEVSRVSEDVFITDMGVVFAHPGTTIWVTPALNYAKRFAFSGRGSYRPLAVIVEVDGGFPGLLRSWKGGFYSKTDIPAQYIKKINVFINIDGQNMWGQLLFDKGETVFIPYLSE